MNSCSTGFPSDEAIEQFLEIFIEYLVQEKISSEAEIEIMQEVLVVSEAYSSIEE